MAVDMETGDPRIALGELIAAHGESYAGLSRMLRRNAAYLQQYVTRGSPKRLAEGDRRTLAAYFGVSEAALGGPTAASAAGVAVRRLDLAASAGPGRLVEEERARGATVTIDRRLLGAAGARPGTLAMIRAEGDSMAPLIEHDDQIIVDEGDCRVGPRGGVFVIRIDDALMVKRVRRAGDLLTITSDNPAFPPIAPHGVASVKVLGRVVRLSRALS